MADLNQHLKNLNRKADLFKRVFNTPDGKEVLKALREELDHDMTMHMTANGEHTHRTAFMLGNKGAVEYIQQLIEREVNNG